MGRVGLSCRAPACGFVSDCVPSSRRERHDGGGVGERRIRARRERSDNPPRRADRHQTRAVPATDAIARAKRRLLTPGKNATAGIQTWLDGTSGHAVGSAIGGLFARSAFGTIRARRRYDSGLRIGAEREGRARRLNRSTVHVAADHRANAGSVCGSPSCTSLEEPRGPLVSMHRSVALMGKLGALWWEELMWLCRTGKTVDHELTTFLRSTNRLGARPQRPAGVCFARCGAVDEDTSPYSHTWQQLGQPQEIERGAREHHQPVDLRQATQLHLPQPRQSSSTSRGPARGVAARADSSRSRHDGWSGCRSHSHRFG